MESPFRRRIPAALGAIRPLNDELAAFLSSRGVSAASIHDVQLVFEEIAANIVRHGTPPGARVGVQLEVEPGPDAILLRVADDGRPFDPTTVADAPPSPGAPGAAETAERAGGFGLSIVRRMTSAIAYRREGVRNVLEMSVPRR